MTNAERLDKVEKALNDIAADIIYAMKDESDIPTDDLPELEGDDSVEDWPTAEDELDDEDGHPQVQRGIGLTGMLWCMSQKWIPGCIPMGVTTTVVSSM